MSGKISCYIAAAMLILMLVAVFLNARYIKNTADHIISVIDSAESLNEDSHDSIAMIARHWNDRISVLKLSVSQKELEEISQYINEALICAKNRDEEEYKKSMARLRRAIEGIKQREEITLENVF